MRLGAAKPSTCTWSRIPAHLEAVDPVAAGRARAKQVRFGEGGEDKLIPIVIHGDAAFAGQGVLAETMNLATIDGFSIGGTIHIVVNNLIGFTAGPAEVNSPRDSPPTWPSGCPSRFST